MDITRVIRERRSIFPPQFTTQPISKPIIEEVLENANHAPTHRLTQPWRFKVIQGAAKTRLGDFLSDTYIDITSDEKFSPFKHQKIKKNCEAAHTIIAIGMQRDPKARIPEWEEIAATAMAVQNMWLTCTAYQIGSYWSSPSYIDTMHQFFDLEEGETCLGFFYMGYYDTEVPLLSKRQPITNRVVWMD